MAEAAQGIKTLPRIGLVATDELRIAGLTVALAEGAGLELMLLAEPRALEFAGLELVLIDAAATGHVVELVKSFRRLRPRIKLLVIGGEDQPEFIEQVVAAGARGVLSHDGSEDELRMAVSVVRDGSVWAPRKVLSRLLDRATRSPFAPVEVNLTRRELEVLRLLVKGYPNREIAEQLAVEPAAVKAHVGRLLRKAGVSNRLALGVHAMASKWV